MQVCVVGGSGFIGSKISEKLTALNIPFVIVDKRPSPVFGERVRLADIRDIDALRNSVQGDCIVHLAAAHRDDIQPISVYDDVNILGTENICAVADERGIDSIVFASSVAVYGFAEINTDESGRVAPFNDYGRTKAAAEEVLYKWQACKPDTRSLTIIRPTVVFGPGNRGNVFNLFNQIAKKRFVMIGKGRNVKSLAYVDNVADFFIHFIGQRPGVQTFNYVDGPDLTMNELVSLVRGRLFGSYDVGLRLPMAIGSFFGVIADFVAVAVNRRLPLSSQRVKKFVANTSFSTKYKETHMFKPKVDLKSGIDMTLDLDFKNPDKDRPVFFTE